MISDFFMMWSLAKVESQRNRLIHKTRVDALMKKGYYALTANRLKKLKDKYQMLRIIQLFSERRPELLLAFSKMFLHLNTDPVYLISNSENASSTTSRMCSTTLAKYVLEKWKCLQLRLRKANNHRLKAQRLYIYNLFRKGLEALREGVHVV